MINLASYKQNGINKNYIVVMIGRDGRMEYETFSTRKQAETANEMKYDLQGKVFTFKQAVEEYPDNFRL